MRTLAAAYLLGLAYLTYRTSSRETRELRIAGYFIAGSTFLAVVALY